MPSRWPRSALSPGLTFWLGNATVLGLGILHSPQAAGPIDQSAGLAQPRSRHRHAGAVLGLLCRLGVERATRDRSRDWQVRLPNGPSTLVQICHRHFRSRLLRDRHVHVAAGRAEYRLCRAGRWCSSPATLLGFASHAPGGLGVFDAAMLVALWQYDKEDVRGRVVAVPAALLFRAVRDCAGDPGHARNMARSCGAPRSRRRRMTTRLPARRSAAKSRPKKTDAG